MKILVINPAHRHNYFTPQIYANLKAYHDFSIPKNKEEWLPPIYGFHHDIAWVKNHIKKFGVPDIVALSCYVWNTKSVYNMAKYLKEINSNCIVVAGGPDVDYENKNYFKLNPFIDVCVKADGEVTFTEIIKCANLGHNFEAISGLVLPSGDTGVSDTSSSMDFSSLLMESDYFDGLIKERRKDNLGTYVYFQSVRGCPYACTFCDWGPRIIKKKDIELAKKELTWMGEHKVDLMWILDANFGMLPRDIELAKHLVEVKKEFGWPKRLRYYADKNATERVVEIVSMFVENGLVKQHLVPIQSSNKKVLEVMKRTKPKNADRVYEKLVETNLDIRAQFILGTPNDTVETIVESLTDAAESGLHSYYQTFPLLILPGTQMNTKKFRKEYKIETIVRNTNVPFFTDGGISDEDCDELKKLKKKMSKRVDSDNFNSEWCISTSSYNKDDWILMQLHKMLIQVFHNYGYTQYISRYLRKEKGIRYYDFYKDLCEFIINDMRKDFYIDDIKIHLKKFLKDSKISFEMPLHSYPSIHLDPSLFLMYQIQTIDLTPIKIWLLSNFDESEVFEDLIDFNFESVFTIDYYPGKIISSKYNWWEYFSKKKPLKKVSSKFSIMDEKVICEVKTTKVTWHKVDGDDRNLRFLTECLGKWDYHRLVQDYV